MKTLHKWIFLCALCVSTLCHAQDYKPTDKWPYVFEKFSPAVIHHSGGNGLTSNVNANVAVDDGSLHYLEDDTILQLRTSSIESVDFDSRKFMAINNNLMEVLVDTPDGKIVKALSVKGDTGGVDIGFGINSSTNAASTLDLTAVTAFGNSLLHAKIAEAMTASEYGTFLTVETKLYFFIDGALTPATKKDFTEAVGKDAANTFLKANKIKWNEPGTMVPAIAFIKANK